MWWKCWRLECEWDWWLDRKRCKKWRRKGKRVETEGQRQVFWRGRVSLKRVLAFPHEEVLMPYWTELLMNRCAVLGPCDPGFTSCMVTHPIEVHQIRAGRGRHPPHSGLRWRDIHTAALSLGPAGWDGGLQNQPHPKSTALECKQPWIKMDLQGSRLHNNYSF